MSVLELIAVVFSLASVVLAVRRHAATWPVGMIAVAAYFTVFTEARLYADAALQGVFFAQGVYGWACWMRSGRVAGAATEAPIVALEWPRRLAIAALVTAAAWGIATGLSRYTDASSPRLDATVSVLSLTANWLLARRVIDNWALWIIADVLYIGLFVSKGLNASAALYAVFLVLAIAGWRSWRHQRGSQVASGIGPSHTRRRPSPTPARGIA